MALVEAFRSRGLTLQETVHKWIAVGFLLYLGSIFFLGGSHQKTFFYLLVALPALFLLVRSALLFRQDSWALASVVLFLSYFSLSTLWSGGEGSIRDAAKYSLYIYCLMLGIEGAINRFGPQFIPGFIAVAGGVAACGYVLSMLLGDVPLSAFVTGRYSLQQMAGWGPGNPINSAIVFGVVAIAAWWSLPNKKWPVQLGLMVVIGLAVTLMFVTKSRGPMLSLTVILLLIGLVRRSKVDLLLLALGGALIAVGVALSNLDAVVAQRVSSPNYRGEIWSQVWQQFQSHWLIGRGLGNDAEIAIANGQVVTHSHSSLFEAFRTGGLLGGLLFIGMTLMLVRRSLRRPEGYFFALWLIFGGICLSTNGRALLTKPSIEWISFWMPLFLLYFTTRADGKTQKNSLATDPIRC
ncbi:O-antigen ligase [Pseudomonas sp. TE3786]